jgi:hypothetical protein
MRDLFILLGGRAAAFFGRFLHNSPGSTRFVVAGRPLRTARRTDPYERIYTCGATVMR